MSWGRSDAHPQILRMHRKRGVQRGEGAKPPLDSKKASGTDTLGPVRLIWAREGTGKGVCECRRVAAVEPVAFARGGVHAFALVCAGLCLAWRPCT